MVARQRGMYKISALLLFLYILVCVSQVCVVIIGLMGSFDVTKAGMRCPLYSGVFIDSHVSPTNLILGEPISDIARV